MFEYEYDFTEQELQEILDDMVADGLIGTYFDEESGEQMYFSKKELN